MPKIAIIDLDSVCYSIGNGNKILDEQGQPKRDEKGRLVYIDKTEDELKASADFYMNQILKGGEFTHYLGFLKGHNTTGFRLEANPEYKANRSKEPPTWWNFVCNDLFSRWHAKYVNDMEVDDMVNLCRLGLSNSHIVAIDGDLLSLEGTHYDWRKGLWVTKSHFDEQLKFWTDMIVGQPGDNVKGLPGRGKAFATKLFEQWFSHQVDKWSTLVFNAYIKELGEYRGIIEFHRNYVSLKILDKYPVVIPEPIPVPAEEKSKLFY